MTTTTSHPHVLSVTEAAARGLSRLVKDAEAGADVVLERRGQAVAAIVSTARLAELQSLEADLRTTALILARAATDTGSRTDLDEVIDALGYTRAQLEAEVDDDLVAGRA